MFVSPCKYECERGATSSPVGAIDTRIQRSWEDRNLLGEPTDDVTITHMKRFFLNTMMSCIIECKLELVATASKYMTKCTSSFNVYHLYRLSEERDHKGCNRI